MKKKADHTKYLDLDIAREMVDAFVHSTGVGCHLINAEGGVLYRQELGGALHAGCRALLGDLDCGALHLNSACKSERLGGRYIYYCPMGMGCFSSPIMLGGKFAGALSAGPVVVTDLEDLIDNTPALQTLSAGNKRAEAAALLRQYPRRQPDELRHISAMLFSTAMYIGEGHNSLLEYQRTQELYQGIGNCVQNLKQENAPKTYPIEQEHTLVRAVSEGDLSEVKRLFDKLLGHILFHTGKDFAALRARSLEVSARLSRAAADSGANLEQVLSLNQRFIKESESLRSTEDLIVCLRKIVEQYTILVFDLVDVKRKDIIYKAIDYMKCSFHRKLTLEDTARYVGFAPTYFSKVFKEEMGTTFTKYLRMLRLDHSKVLLLTSQLSLGEVCHAVGFEDQSYFIKIFRRYTGMTPGDFRKRQGIAAKQI